MESFDFRYDAGIYARSAKSLGLLTLYGDHYETSQTRSRWPGHTIANVIGC